MVSMYMPDIFSDVIDVSVKVVLDEVNIYISRLSEAHGPLEWGWAHPIS